MQFLTPSVSYFTWEHLHIPEVRKKFNIATPIQEKKVVAQLIEKLNRLQLPQKIILSNLLAISENPIGQISIIDLRTALNEVPKISALENTYFYKEGLKLVLETSQCFYTICPTLLNSAHQPFGTLLFKNQNFKMQITDGTIGNIGCLIDIIPLLETVEINTLQNQLVRINQTSAVYGTVSFNIFRDALLQIARVSPTAHKKSLIEGFKAKKETILNNFNLSICFFELELTNWTIKKQPELYSIYQARFNQKGNFTFEFDEWFAILDCILKDPKHPLLIPVLENYANLNLDTFPANWFTSQISWSKVTNRKTLKLQTLENFYKRHKDLLDKKQTTQFSSELEKFMNARYEEARNRLAGLRQNCTKKLAEIEQEMKNLFEKRPS